MNFTEHCAGANKYSAVSDECSVEIALILSNSVLITMTGYMEFSIVNHVFWSFYFEGYLRQVDYGPDNPLILLKKALDCSPGYYSIVNLSKKYSGGILMKIGEVMELTGLTRKAIKFYEQEGLISPIVDPDNGYREYSEVDVHMLVQIAILRQINVPIDNIRQILRNPVDLKGVLAGHLQKLEDDLQKLEKSKAVLQSCLEEMARKELDLPEVADKLALLNQCLEMDSRRREGFMRQALERIFPGMFGKMLVIHFSPFLNEPLDTPAKEAAWLELVNFLDETPEVSYTAELQEFYAQLPANYLEEYEIVAREQKQKLIAPTEEDLLEQRKIISEYLENMSKLQENPEIRAVLEKTEKMKQVLREQLMGIGYYEKFVKNLRVLSNDYGRYLENLEKLGHS